MTDQAEFIDITIERIRSALGGGRIEDALSILLEVHPADQAEIFNRLPDPDQDILLSRLGIRDTADLLEELADREVLDAIESLTTERLADLLDEMEPDEAADLLGDLPAAQVTEVLAQMEDAEEVLPLLGYPDESAGGLMTTSYVALRRTNTAQQAIQFLRQIHPDNEVPYYLYVVDRERRLVGIVGLRELIVVQPDTLIDSIMDEEVAFVTVETDQEEVARIMTRYDLVAIPVVNEQKRLVGVITHDDILDVLEFEATEDIYRLGNVADSGLELDSPANEHLRGRLPWLYLNTLTALFASWVITHFEDIISQVAVLAAFQSVVAGLGGNTGSQNIVMVVRSIALGKMDRKRLWRAVRKQALVGALQGLAVGLVVGIGVSLWQGNFYLGLVLLLAMTGNMLVAGVVGTLTPYVLASLGKDPALAGNVLVTAATDSFGFFLFLTLASLFLNYL